MKSISSMARFIFSVGEYPIFSVSFVKKTIFSPLCCLCTVVKDQLTILMWVCFWTLCFIPLLYSFADTTLPWLLQLCKSWVLSIFWLRSPSMLGLSPLHVDFEIVCWNQQNNLLGSLLKLGWLYRSSWEELTSWQYWAFLPMNMKYLSSYLVLF